MLGAGTALGIWVQNTIPSHCHREGNLEGLVHRGEVPGEGLGWGGAPQQQLDINPFQGSPLGSEMCGMKHLPGKSAVSGHGTEPWDRQKTLLKHTPGAARC